MRAASSSRSSFSRALSATSPFAADELPCLPMTFPNFAAAMAVPRLTRRLGNGRLLAGGLTRGADRDGLAERGSPPTTVAATLARIARPMILIRIGQGGSLSPPRPSKASWPVSRGRTLGRVPRRARRRRAPSSAACASGRADAVYDETPAPVPACSTREGCPGAPAMATIASVDVEPAPLRMVLGSQALEVHPYDTAQADRQPRRADRARPASTDFHPASDQHPHWKPRRRG